MKKCTKCGIEKPLSEFHKKKAYKDGHRSVCKSCRKKEGARYYQENKEKIAEYNARYRLENKEKIALYHQENKDKIAEHKARWRQKNKEKIAEYGARYYLENKEKIDEHSARYYQERNDKQTACVYKITNRQNGKIYVGETLRGELRWRDHLRKLRWGS